MRVLFLERRASFRHYAGWGGLRLAEIDEVAITSRLGLRLKLRMRELLYVLGWGRARLLGCGLTFDYGGNSKDLLGLLFG